MALLLGLAAAATYGAADFTAGLVSRRVNALCVVFVSQLAGLAVLAVIVPIEGAGVTARALAWGAVAGIGGGGGVTFLYRGLARARMAVVAPITAVEAAIIPVLYGLVTGEQPGALALVGVVIALVAVALVAAPRADDVEPGAPTPSRRFRRLAQPGIKDALLAGLGFGCFFIFLTKTGDDAGMWPLIGTKMSSITLVALAALIARNSLRPVTGTWGPIVLAGVLDVAANVFYLLATRTGLLSLVAVATSLYPASTVLLARTVLHERMSRGQLAGLVLVITGVALMAGG
jgi:drug/metabolite transporter (DMT)-like permease